MTKDVNLVIIMPKVPSQNCSDFHQFMTIMTGALKWAEFLRSASPVSLSLLNDVVLFLNTSVIFFYTNS